VRREMQQEVLESVFVEMDPVLHGFAGVLVELPRVGEGYTVLETAAGVATACLTFSPRASPSPGRSSTPSCAAQGSRYCKCCPTFFDALALVPKGLWAQETSFCESLQEADSLKVPRQFVERLIDALCYAA
jgi:hypothetical protein